MRTTTTSPTPTVVHTDFLKIKESAKELGCGERWLRDGINHSGFPHHRLGKSLQTSAQDRDEIRRLCRVPAQAGGTTRRPPRKKPVVRANTAPPKRAGSPKPADTTERAAA